MKRAIAALLLGLWGAIAPAQAQLLDLVADINTGSNFRNSSNPEQFLTVSATTTYFAACDTEAGCELWKTNGSAAGTVRLTDICPGECSASVQNMLRLGNRVYFSADDGQRGREPWFIDINTEVSALLADVNPGAAGSDPLGFVSAFGFIYFTAIFNGSRTRLMRTDGSTIGTTAINTSRLWSSTVVVAFGDSLYGASAPLAATSDRELTRVVATTGVATVVRDINVGSGSSSIDNLQVAFNPPRLVFRASDPVGTGQEIWVSDGTQANTVVLEEQIPGSETSSPNQLTVVGDRLFFTADNRPGTGTGNSNVELYVSSGSAATTALVREINPSLTVGSTPVALRAFGSNEVFFLANDGTTGSEMWRSDGTSGGTLQIRDFMTTGTGTISSPVAIVTNGFYYVTSTDALFRTDGTSANSRQVGSPQPDSFGVGIDAIGAGNGFVYFDGFSGQNFGSEPMRTAIASPNTVDLLRNIANEIGNANPSDFAQVNGRSVFFAYDSVDGIEPRVIAAPGAAPALLAQTIQGSNSFGLGNRFYNEFVVSGTRAFFVVDYEELWVTDGTSAGTVLVKNYGADFGGFTPVDCLTPIPGGVLLLAETRDLSGSDVDEFWTSDGTNAGTVRLAATPNAVVPSCLSGESLPVLGNFVLTVGEEVASLGGVARGRELYRFNLSTGTGELVRDIQPGTGSSHPSGFHLVGSTMYFSAAEFSGDTELWRSDGTTQGTQGVADINPSGASSPSSFAHIGSILYFHALGPSGREVYRSDGTTAGTTILRDIQAGAGDSQRFNSELVVSGDRLYFAAVNSPARLGARLFVSDGTTAGTVELGNIPASQPGNAPQRLVAAPGGAVLFSGWSPDAGRELWYSNGSNAGTLRIDNLAAGAISANPTELAVIGNDLYLSADNDLIGREAYTLDVRSLDFDRVFDNSFE